MSRIRTGQKWQSASEYSPYFGEVFCRHFTPLEINENGDLLLQIPDEPQNLCQALPAIQELFGNGSVPKLIPLGGGWR